MKIKKVQLKKILIIGLGPAGGILAAHLIKSGVNVTCVDILTHYIEAVKTKGLRISNKTEITVKIPNSFTSVKKAYAVFKDYDAIFVCVKGYALNKIVEELKPLVAKESKIVCCMNGLDVEDIVSSELGVERTFRIVVNYAGNIVAPGEICMTFFNPPNYMGTFTAAGADFANEIAMTLSHSGLITEVCQDIKKYEWKKTIRNAVMAPICALTGGNIAEMLKFTLTRDLTENLLVEGITVAKAAGYDLGHDFFELSMDYLSKGGSHKPSMLIDILEGRKTEIAFINGKIAEYGKKLGIKTPYNTGITALIMAREDIRRGER